MKTSKRLLCVLLTLVFVCLPTVCPAASSGGETREPPFTDGVRLWSRREYRGDQLVLVPGDYPDVSFRARSVEIPSAYVVTGYTGRDFTGESYELVDSQNAFLRYDFGLGLTRIKRLRSLRVRLVVSDAEDVTDLTDAGKDALMRRYAPRIWMAKDDPYEACSMEYVMEKFTPSVDDDGTGRISTIEQPSSPFDILETYYGDQATAKAYAFWIEKPGGYVDFSYFQFCPFDSGKYIKLIRHMAGSHPGDWEHVTLRFIRFAENGRQYIRPVKVAFPAHTFAALESWETIPKIDGTHIEIYCAAGTHGMYPTEGEHVYLDLGPIQKLTDVCSKGEIWDLWTGDRLETFEHNVKTGSRALAGSPWAHLFGYDKGPDCASIMHWGNKTYFPVFRGAGPDGPQYKTELHDLYALK